MKSFSAKVGLVLLFSISANIVCGKCQCRLFSDIAGSYWTSGDTVFIRKGDTLEFRGNVLCGGSPPTVLNASLKYYRDFELLDDYEGKITESGFYQVVWDYINCYDSWFVRVVFVDYVGVEDVSGISAFNIFPNPFTSAIYLSAHEENSAPLQFSVYDITGKEIYSSSLSFTGNSAGEEIDLSFLPKGIYAAVLNAGDKKTQRRIIKQ